MSKETTPGLDDVAKLMLERQQYESWLASLDAKRASTPEAVFQRVRGDYAARLKSVTEALITRRASIQAHAEMLNSRLTQLESDAQRVRDERAEAELRMQVGELAVTEWNTKVRESDEAIIRLTEAQSQVRSQLAQAREIVVMVAAQSGSSTATPQAGQATSPPSLRKPTPARSSRPVSLDQVKAAETAASGNGPGTKPGGRSPVNELEFLNSVVGAPGERPKRAAGLPAPPKLPAESRKTPGPDSNQAAQIVEQDGAPDLASSLLSRISENNGAGTLREEADAESLLAPKVPAKPSGGRAVPPPPAQPASPPGPKAQPLAANVTESNPIVLKPQGGLERHKTLKCAECGTMNYPTEWYCERCGAELSAI